MWSVELDFLVWRTCCHSNLRAGADLVLHPPLGTEGQLVCFSSAVEEDSVQFTVSLNRASSYRDDPQAGASLEVRFVEHRGEICGAGDCR
jgi:hypothetical protein